MIPDSEPGSIKFESSTIPVFVLVVLVVPSNECEIWRRSRSEPSVERIERLNDLELADPSLEPSCKGWLVAEWFPTGPSSFQASASDLADRLLR